MDLMSKYEEKVHLAEQYEKKVIEIYDEAIKETHNVIINILKSFDKLSTTLLDIQTHERKINIKRTKALSLTQAANKLREEANALTISEGEVLGS